jgi:hypothetical protein
LLVRQQPPSEQQAPVWQPSTVFGCTASAVTGGDFSAWRFAQQPVVQSGGQSAQQPGRQQSGLQQSAAFAAAASLAGLAVSWGKTKAPAANSGTAAASDQRNWHLVIAQPPKQDRKKNNTCRRGPITSVRLP